MYFLVRISCYILLWNISSARSVVIMGSAKNTLIGVLIGQITHKTLEDFKLNLNSIVLEEQNSDFNFDEQPKKVYGSCELAIQMLNKQYISIESQLKQLQMTVNTQLKMQQSSSETQAERHYATQLKTSQIIDTQTRMAEVLKSIDNQLKMYQQTAETQSKSIEKQLRNHEIEFNAQLQTNQENINSRLNEMNQIVRDQSRIIENIDTQINVDIQSNIHRIMAEQSRDQQSEINQILKNTSNQSKVIQLLQNIEDQSKIHNQSKITTQLDILQKAIETQPRVIADQLKNNQIAIETQLNMKFDKIGFNFTQLNLTQINDNQLKPLEILEKIETLSKNNQKSIETLSKYNQKSIETQSELSNATISKVTQILNNQSKILTQLNIHQITKDSQSNSISTDLKSVLIAIETQLRSYPMNINSQLTKISNLIQNINNQCNQSNILRRLEDHSRKQQQVLDTHMKAYHLDVNTNTKTLEILQSIRTVQVDRLQNFDTLSRNIQKCIDVESKNHYMISDAKLKVIQMISNQNLILKLLKQAIHIEHLDLGKQ